MAVGSAAAAVAQQGQPAAAGKGTATPQQEAWRDPKWSQYKVRRGGAAGL